MFYKIQRGLIMKDKREKQVALPRKTKQINIRVTENFYKQLCGAAKVHEKNLSELIEYVLDYHIESLAISKIIAQKFNTFSEESQRAILMAEPCMPHIFRSRINSIAKYPDAGQISKEEAIRLNEEARQKMDKDLKIKKMEYQNLKELIETLEESLKKKNYPYVVEDETGVEDE